MSESATIEAPTETPAKPFNPRQYRLTADQTAKAKRLYLIDRLSSEEIAKAIDAPSPKTINNLAYREGWARERARIDRRKEAAVSKAAENVLARVERQLAERADTAVAIFADSLEQAEQRPAGKRLAPLTEAKLALAIASDVSGRDRQSKDSQTTIHMHLSSAWSPRRVDAIDVETVESPATGLNSGDSAHTLPSRIADVARPE